MTHFLRENNSDVSIQGLKEANIIMLDDIKENMLFMNKKHRKSQQRKRIHMVPNENSKPENYNLLNKTITEWA